MKLVTKLGIVTLAAITVAPVVTVANPVNAQAKAVKRVKKASKKRSAKKPVAKAKHYKISKNILRSKKRVIYKDEGMGIGIILEQYRSNKLRIMDSIMNWSQFFDYKITKQTVKGNTMTLKLTTKGVKNVRGCVKGTGTIKLIRTGKNSYKIPKIYRMESTEARINNQIVRSAVNEGRKEKPKAKVIKGLKTATIKSLNSRHSLMHYGMSLSAYK